ncbi:pro-resilin-like [Anoplophora glabripennis]|uniref:pro-resilin-like n=1 Tax=Anoplophora glabripennis TaxID=217634 RepID=UPI0008738A23|nr:pro-resilin-like [Anoplophora glabripennis]XP_018578157.1 pro-resilin-like [Anoplophora glabripennis]
MASSEDTIPTPSRNSSIKHPQHLAVDTVTLDPVITSIMNSFSVVFALALAAAVVAEPPSGYSYSRPSGGGGGGYSLGGGLSGGGGGYTAVSSGYQTSEGASVDHALLEQVRQILLKEEQNSASSGSIGGISSSYGAPSSQYGVPSSSYGVPGYQTRVVGIDLEGIKQAIQVAQYQQISHQAGGYPSGPSSSYGAPSRPSGSYGAPY